MCTKNYKHANFRAKLNQKNIDKNIIIDQIYTYILIENIMKSISIFMPYC